MFQILPTKGASGHAGRCHYDTMPKAVPGPSRDTDTHDRIRHDVVDKSGTVTLRVAGQLRHIGVGRTHSRTHVILLIQDLDVRIVNAITGELLRELTIDTTKNYNPRNDQDPNPLPWVRVLQMS